MVWQRLLLHLWQRQRQRRCNCCHNGNVFPAVARQLLMYHICPQTQCLPHNGQCPFVSNLANTNTSLLIVRFTESLKVGACALKYPFLLFEKDISYFCTQFKLSDKRWFIKYCCNCDSFTLKTKH